MRNLYFPLAAALLWAACATAPTADMSSFDYPDTRTEDVTDTYFGTEVADPYRWLEDDRSEATGAWVEAQNAVTRGHLDAIPFRNAIRDRCEQIFNYEKVGAPRKIGDRYYISKNDGLQNQAVLWVQDEGGEERRGAVEGALPVGHGPDRRGLAHEFRERPVHGVPVGAHPGAAHRTATTGRGRTTTSRIHSRQH